MRRSVVDIKRLHEAAEQARGTGRSGGAGPAPSGPAGTPWRGSEWQRELLACGVLIDLAGDILEPITGIQRSLGDLLRAEERLVAEEHAVAWSVGGASWRAWAIIAGTIMGILVMWNARTEVFSVVQFIVWMLTGAVFLGSLAWVGLGQYQRMKHQRRVAIAAAQRALKGAREGLTARVLALRPEDFPMRTAGVLLETGVVSRVPG